MNNNSGILAIGVTVILILFWLLLDEFSQINKFEKEYEARYTYSYNSLPCDASLIKEVPMVSLKLDTVYRYVGTHILTIGDYEFKHDTGITGDIRDYQTDILYGASFFIDTREQNSILKDFILKYGKTIENVYGISLTLYTDGDYGHLTAENITIKNNLSNIKKKIEEEKNKENAKKANDMKEKMLGQ